MVKGDYMVDPEELMEKALEKAKESKKKERAKKESEPPQEIDYLYCGWGIRPDQYVFARIIAWSLDRRKVFCRLAKKEKIKLGSKNYKFVPGELYGDTFKLYKTRSKNGELCFKGRYPYETGLKKDGLKKGTFYPHKKENKSS